ncbi:unnamed protein product [Haemonchus placei]|uniref:Uncharacterized protein n=1 Tax=Haemonchus placei TaxID=6290 RepID=A0A0N4VU83_HAEPC|nr:unnamed protein product [Haemonchus placei]
MSLKKHIEEDEDIHYFKFRFQACNSGIDTGYVGGRHVTSMKKANLGVSSIQAYSAVPTVARRRRARSLPVRRNDCSQFVRFRSLREAKPERRDRRRPFKVEVVSIPSSTDSKVRRRKNMRERARQRLESQGLKGPWGREDPHKKTLNPENMSRTEN